MTRQTWEEELDSRRLARIECLLEEIRNRLPPPPQYKPTTAIVVVVDQAVPSIQRTDFRSLPENADAQIPRAR